MVKALVNDLNIRSVSWSDGTLAVSFRSGALYRHSRVPYAKYRQLLLAAHKEYYYRRNIRYTYALSYQREGKFSPTVLKSPANLNVYNEYFS